MRLAGNLPYNISTPLLFHLARHADRVRDMHFMLQLEVVDATWVAAPGTAEYGRLSVALQARFAMQKLFSVSKGAFRPPPKVESAVVWLAPLAAMLAIDGTCCAPRVLRPRRKQLRNALPLAPGDYAELAAPGPRACARRICRRRTMRASAPTWKTSGSLDELDSCAPSGILDEAITEVPHFTGPGSRRSPCRPLLRTRSHACLTSGTPMARWPRRRRPSS